MAELHGGGFQKQGLPRNQRIFRKGRAAIDGVYVCTQNLHEHSLLQNFLKVQSVKKQKLKQLERNQIELESTREELKEKIHEQTKLKRDIELLKMENMRLKNNMKDLVYPLFVPNSGNFLVVIIDVSDLSVFDSNKLIK